MKKLALFAGVIALISWGFRRRRFPSISAGSRRRCARGGARWRCPSGDTTYRFVSTHLEFQDALPVQLGQVQELIATFGQDAIPTIMAGDFNSDASGLRPDRATPSYQMIVDAGFTDTWTNPFERRHVRGLTTRPHFDQRAAVSPRRIDYFGSTWYVDTIPASMCEAT